MTDIFFESWGAGTPVVLVHGSLATGAEEWQAQRPLAEEGYRLLVLDRRGYGRSPTIEGEDFLRDADDIAELMERRCSSRRPFLWRSRRTLRGRAPARGDAVADAARTRCVCIGPAQSSRADTRARGSPRLGRAAAG